MRSGHVARGPIAAINVTPFIDVLLVLLILFMVITPIARPSIDTRLPDSTPPAASSSPPPAVVLELDGSGFKLNGTYLASLSAQAERLRNVMLVRSDKTLLVRASGELTYGSVVNALDVVRGAGVERIGLLGVGPASTRQSTTQ